MSLAGKNVIVTGSNTGIGRVTAEELARQGAQVFLACRSEDKTRGVVDGIRAAGGRAEFMALDLADLTATRATAEAFAARKEPLHLLVNNAGIGGPVGQTKDGFEIAFGTNHVGPYLFTRLLMPALEAAGGARVVSVASTVHYKAKAIDWDAVRKPTKSITGMPEYEVSKLANVLFSSELGRRVSPTVHTYALHPGVVASDVWRRVPWGIRHIMKAFMLSTEQGARTTLFCATSDDVASHTGRYYDTSKEREPSKLARDERLARELWERTAEWTGLPAA